SSQVNVAAVAATANNSRAGNELCWIIYANSAASIACDVDCPAGCEATFNRNLSGDAVSSHQSSHNEGRGTVGRDVNGATGAQDVTRHDAAGNTRISSRRDSYGAASTHQVARLHRHLLDLAGCNSRAVDERTTRRKRSSVVNHNAWIAGGGALKHGGRGGYCYVPPTGTEPGCIDGPNLDGGSVRDE